MESHKLRDKALKAIGDTTFYPNKGKERLKSMIETRPDWCVSRQEYGSSSSIFITKELKKFYDDLLENIYQFIKKRVQIVGFQMIHKDFGSKYGQMNMKNLVTLLSLV